MNLGEAKQRVAMLTGDYSERGVVKLSTDEQVADFYLKMPVLFDMAQKQISEVAYIKKYFYISHIMPFKVEDWQLDTYTHTTQDIEFTSPTAFAYCFKVDSDAEVVISAVYGGVETELMTIRGYSDGGFTLFKGLIDEPEEYDYIKIKFTGDTYYNIKDIMLFDCKFAHYDMIPDFGAYIRYQMPPDFYRALKADIKRGYNYEPLANFVWESPTEISISVYEKGEIRIEYAATVTTINSNTPDTYEFEISDTAQVAMLSWVASKLVQKTDPAQSQLLMQDYTERMINIVNDTGLRKQQRTVKRVY
jgi:hypothetical protein